MRSFIHAAFNAGALVVSGCIIGIGALLLLAMCMGIYGGGIWFCLIGLDWAGHAAAQDPLIGYPIIALLLLLTLCAWVPALGPVVAFWSTFGISALVCSLAESVRKMITREET